MRNCAVFPVTAFFNCVSVDEAEFLVCGYEGMVSFLFFNASVSVNVGFCVGKQLIQLDKLITERH